MSQRTLAEDSTLPETDQLLSYSTRRLGAQDTTAELHTEARAALTTLRGDASVVRDAVEARMAARAVLGSKTEDLYRGIANVSRWTLAELNNDREDPRYVHAFPRPASEVLRGAISDEKVAYCEVVISHLSAEATLTGLAPHLNDAQALLDAVKAERDNHAATVTAEHAAEATLHRSLAAARDLYNGLYPKLLVLYPKRKGFVDTFFINRRKSQPKVDEQVG